MKSGSFGTRFAAVECKSNFRFGIRTRSIGKKIEKVPLKNKSGRKNAEMGGNCGREKQYPIKKSKKQGKLALLKVILICKGKKKHGWGITK